MSESDTPPEIDTSDDECELVYDMQCPACNIYCHLLGTTEASGQLHLVNARENFEIMKEITARNLDIDQGMVLKIGHQFHYGADAIHKLALITAPSTMFKRFNIWIFRSRRRAELLYPVLRACRNFLLKLLRRTKINNLGRPDNERF